MSPRRKKSKPSPAIRVCGIIVALAIMIIAVWFGLEAQQMGQSLMMYVSFGIAALSFLLCLGIASGKVTPATYIGPFDL
jgi:hypothetical protein